MIELEEVVELADAVAASNGIASGMGTFGYGVQVVVEANNADRAVELAMAVLAEAVERSGLLLAGGQRGDHRRGRRHVLRHGRGVIRLGSLAGYPFEGPRLLAGWTPPQNAAVFAVMYKPDTDAKPEEYAVLYVGHSDDLCGTAPLRSSGGLVLVESGCQQAFRALHRHLRGTGSQCPPSGADHPRADRHLSPRV